MLPLAWDMCWVWKSFGEQHHRGAMLADVLLALLATALHWDWLDIALLLGIGFFGMLRPGELLALWVRDLIFDSDPLFTDSMFVRIIAPKMRRLGPRWEHVRIDDADFVRFTRVMTRGLDRDTVLFTGGYFALSDLFRQLCLHFSVSNVDGTGLTPASLRSGGATFWYRRTDSTEFVRYWGRWANSRMLRIYIQEAAACSFLADQPAPVQDRIRAAARLTPWILHQLLAEF